MSEVLDKAAYRTRKISASSSSSTEGDNNPHYSDLVHSDVDSKINQPTSHTLFNSKSKGDVKLTNKNFVGKATTTDSNNFLSPFDNSGNEEETTNLYSEKLKTEVETQGNTELLSINVEGTSSMQLSKKAHEKWKDERQNLPNDFNPKKQSEMGSTDKIKNKEILHNVVNDKDINNPVNTEPLKEPIRDLNKEMNKPSESIYGKGGPSSKSKCPSNVQSRQISGIDTNISVTTQSCQLRENPEISLAVMKDKSTRNIHNLPKQNVPEGRITSFADLAKERSASGHSGFSTKALPASIAQSPAYRKTKSSLDSDSDEEETHTSQTLGKSQKPVKAPPYLQGKSVQAIEEEIRRKKKVLGTTNLKCLPDKGEKLKIQVNELEEYLRSLKIGEKKICDKSSDKHQMPLASSSISETAPLKLQDVTLDLKKVTTSKIKLIDPSEGNFNSVKTESKPGSSGASIGNTFLNLHGEFRTKCKELQKFASCLETQPPEEMECTPPKELKTKLLPHQLQALTWLRWRESQKSPGGILADAMGLGKTLTMLALVLKQNRKGSSEEGKGDTAKLFKGGTLVICPLSLLHQWKQEADRHCHNHTRMRCCLYYDKERSISTEELSSCDIVITTYDVARIEFGKFIKSTSGLEAFKLYQILWNRIILDEAHYIKNKKSERAKAVCALQAVKRWAVSGTPIHNDTQDLHSLLKFLRCAPFDDEKFWKDWNKRTMEQGTNDLNLFMKCILLRRKKDELNRHGKPLIQLPQKKVKEIELDLEEEERNIYKQVDSWSRSALKTNKSQALDRKHKGSLTLVILLRLQQICCHLALLKKEAVDEIWDNDEGSELSSLLADMTLDANVSMGASNRLDALGLENFSDNPKFRIKSKSTKVQKLLKILKKINEDSDGNDKSVIVSQWTSFLDIIHYHLSQHGYQCEVIKGSVPVAQRTTIMNSFNSDPDGPKVLLLSLKAGGVGLNLIGGSHLFLMDIHWNPALESQACDRIHRVGQLKPVTIYKFVCKDTVEANIRALQRSKETLAEGIMKKKKLTPEDYKVLLGYNYV